MKNSEYYIELYKKHIHPFQYSTHLVYNNELIHVILITFFLANLFTSINEILSYYKLVSLLT